MGCSKLLLLLVLLHTESKQELAHHPGRLSFLFLRPLGKHALHLHSSISCNASKAEYSKTQSTQQTWRTHRHQVVDDLTPGKEVSKVCLLRRTY